MTGVMKWLAAQVENIRVCVGRLTVRTVVLLLTLAFGVWALSIGSDDFNVQSSLSPLDWAGRHDKVRDLLEGVLTVGALTVANAAISSSDLTAHDTFIAVAKVFMVIYAGAFVIFALITIHQIYSAGSAKLGHAEVSSPASFLLSLTFLIDWTLCLADNVNRNYLKNRQSSSLGETV